VLDFQIPRLHFILLFFLIKGTIRKIRTILWMCLLFGKIGCYYFFVYFFSESNKMIFKVIYLIFFNSAVIYNYETSQCLCLRLLFLIQMQKLNVDFVDKIPPKNYKRRRIFLIEILIRAVYITINGRFLGWIIIIIAIFAVFWSGRFFSIILGCLGILGKMYMSVRVCMSVSVFVVGE
jgi:hypothetical protein